MRKTRQIIHIDEERCDGCGQCITACAEGALELVDGKARLVGEVYCDGLGACIGECPQGALTIEQRESEPFDEKAVRGRLESQAPHDAGQGCPAAALRTFHPESVPTDVPQQDLPSLLGHWPIQLRLVPPDAPFLKQADLVVCADCVPFAVPDFHRRYLAGRSVVIACPKLDDIDDYRAKLSDLFEQSRPSRVTVLRMEVPCCGALTQAVMDARNKTRPDMPVEVHTIGLGGGIDREVVPDGRSACEGAAR